MLQTDKKMEISKITNEATIPDDQSDSSMDPGLVQISTREASTPSGEFNLDEPEPARVKFISADTQILTGLNPIKPKSQSKKSLKQVSKDTEGQVVDPLT